MSEPKVPPEANARTSDVPAGKNPPAEAEGGRGSCRAGEGPSPVEEAATVVLEDLESLRARAEQAERERDQFLALLQRTRADFENYQKRAAREREQERRYGHGALALDLLPVLDNLERAQEAARQAGETGPLAQGVGMVLTQFLDVLRRHGIAPIEALGRPFDPALHQAVMQQPSKDHPPNTVIGVLEQGFLIHDRVLRPARVVVSAPVPEPPAAEAPSC